MGHSESKLADQVAEKYPHYKTYRECQSRALTSGMVSIVSGAAVVFIGQELVSKWMSFTVPGRVLGPILGGCVTGYIMTKRSTHFCQNMWLAMEEKDPSSRS